VTKVVIENSAPFEAGMNEEARGLVLGEPGFAKEKEEGRDRLEVRWGESPFSRSRLRVEENALFNENATR
jgi:hypothetical protein